MVRGLLLSAFVTIVMAETAFAGHPLITDDAGTQGKGKFQIEINSEFSRDEETDNEVTTQEDGGELAATISYGVTDTIDIVLGLPYLWSRLEEDSDVTSDEEGIGDMPLEVKWRFYEKEGSSFALKPGIAFPAGDEEKGLGSGRASYSLIFIATEEIGAWAFHLNLGYLRNEYKIEEDRDANRKNIWHVSFASTVAVARDLQIVTNIGTERNPDRESNTHPAFALGGAIYSIAENFDIDLGIKAGLNKPETDAAFLAGMSMRF